MNGLLVYHQFFFCGKMLPKLIQSLYMARLTSFFKTYFHNLSEILRDKKCLIKYWIMNLYFCQLPIVNCDVIIFNVTIFMLTTNQGIIKYIVCFIGFIFLILSYSGYWLKSMSESKLSTTTKPACSIKGIINKGWVSTRPIKRPSEAATKNW